MILSFHIEYRTSWGEEVRVLGSILELGNNQPGKAIPLQTVDGIHWTLDADIQAPENGIVQYSYHIYRDGKDTRTEWNSLPARSMYRLTRRKSTACKTAGRICPNSNTSTRLLSRSPCLHIPNVTPLQRATRKDY